MPQKELNTACSTLRKELCSSSTVLVTTFTSLSDLVHQCPVKKVHGWITQPLRITTAPAAFCDTVADSHCVVAEGTCSLAGDVLLMSSAVTRYPAGGLITDPEVAVGKISMKQQFRWNSLLGVDTTYEEQTGFKTTRPVSWRSGRKTVAPSGSGSRERAP